MNHVKNTKKVVLSEAQLKKGDTVWIMGEGETRDVWGADYFPSGRYAFILTQDSKGKYGSLQIAHGEIKSGSIEHARSVRLMPKRV